MSHLRLTRGAVAGLIALALVPLLVTAVHLASRYPQFTAITDNAQNELIIRDIGSRIIQLGPYSRDGWAHPGPLFFYAAWLPYRAFGSDSIAMLLTAALINAGAIAAMLGTALRVGGRRLAIPLAVGIVILTAQLTDGFLANPWNPYITVLPFGAFVLLCWAAWCEHHLAAAGAVLVGTFCVQTHVGYAMPVAAGLGLVGVVFALRFRRDPGRRRSLLVTGAIAGGIGVVLWLPPIVHQLTHDEGNFGLIATYFTTDRTPAQGFVRGGRVLLSQFTVRPDWLIGPHRFNPFSGEPHAIARVSFPWLLVPFVAALAWSRRRSTVTTRRFGALVAIVMITMWFSLAGIRGPMYVYRVRTVWLLGMLAAVFVAACLVEALAPRVPAARRRVALVLAATLTLGVVTPPFLASLRHARTAQPPDLAVSRDVTRLARQIGPHLPERGAVLIRATSFGSSGAVPGLLLHLEHAGVRTALLDDRTVLAAFDTSRRVPARAVALNLVVATDTDIPVVATRPGYRRIALAGPLTLEDLRRRADRLRELDDAPPRDVFLDPLLARSAPTATYAVFSAPLPTDRDGG